MNTLLQINSVANYGSTGRISEEIGSFAVQNGWESYIAYGRDLRPGKSKLIKIGSELSIKLHGLQTRLFDRHGLGSCSATQKFIEKIIEIKPDIIHLHNLHGYYLNVEILFNFLSQANIPVVWTLHDCWPFTGHCAYFDFVACHRWETGCHDCPQKRAYPASWLFDRSKKNWALKKRLFTSVKRMVLVPVCNWVSGIVRQSSLSGYPTKTIYNGIDTEVFQPTNNTLARTRYNLKDEFIILGVASPWSPRKGFRDFIEMSKHISNNSKIVLVGLDNQQLKNLPENIIGIARTENINELSALYATADVFVNPTWEDNFPTTNLEALACGTPVITYNTGGSVEAISDQCGFIVEKGDIDGLLKACKIIRDHGKDYFTAPCVNRAKRLFDRNDRYRDYLDLYNELIHGISLR